MGDIIPAKFTIFESAFNGDFKIIEDQIKLTPSLVNVSDGNGRILLHWASIGGNARLVLFLLKQGSKADACDKCNTTPLMMAESAGRTEIADILREHCEPDETEVVAIDDDDVQPLDECKIVPKKTKSFCCCCF